MRTGLPCSDGMLDVVLAEHRRAVKRYEAPAEPFADVLQFLTHSLHEPLTLDDLAAEAGLVVAYLRAYKQARGLTPMQDLRVHRLRSSQTAAVDVLTLDRIADQVGLANGFHLGRL